MSTGGLAEEMTPEGSPADVEALATRVKELLWVVLDSVPAELVPWSVMLVRLLQAADTFPRGGMYDGHYGAQAALRYEFFWLPLAARAQAARKPLLVPPLDVSMAWLLHRCTEPASYPTDCHAITGGMLDPPPAQAFRFAGSHAYTQCESLEERQAWASREAWDAAYVYGNGFLDTGIRSNGGGNPLIGRDLGNGGRSRATTVGGASGAASGGSGGDGGGGKGKRWANLRRRSHTGSSSGGSDDGRTGRAPATEAATGELPAGAAEPAWTTATAPPPWRNVVGGVSTGADSIAPYWPPAPPGSRGDLTRRWRSHPPVASSAGGVDNGEGCDTAASSACGRLAGGLTPRISELCPLLHSLLRPAYLDPDVLAQAVQRYCRFLMLQGMHPSVQMVPTTDIALMWVTHMAVPASYRDTCRRLLNRVVVPGPGVLRLQDGSAAFAETQRLYEHHFGEVYDPPLTRAVPLATLHPLMSTPLAPFLAAYDVGSPPPLASDGTNGDGTPAACATGEGLPYSATTASRTEGGHRCGAHALYLAYLLRRGSNRSAKSLLGLLLGHGHRRRAAVRYVANKAAGFRDFLHLPHSDCHVYWSHLRLRRVDPDSVSASATPTPTQSGSQPDDTPASVRQLDDLERDLHATNDMEVDIDGGRRHRLRQRQAVEADEEARGEGEERAWTGPQPQRREGLRRDLAQGLAAPPTRAPTPTATIAGRRMSWVDPVGGISTPRRRSTSSSEGSSLDGDPPPVLQATGPGRGPDRGGGAVPSAWEKPKRIALIVPLPAEPHTTLTVRAASHEAVNKWLSGPETHLASGRKEQSLTLAPSYGLAEGSYSREISQHGMMPVDGYGQPAAATAVASKGAGGGTANSSAPTTIHVMPAPTAAAAPPPSAASSEDSSADLVPSVEVPAAGLPAKAAATQEPHVAWAAPRAQVEREQPKQPQQQQPPPLPDQQPQQTWYGPAAAVQDGELSPLSPPPFVRRKNEDGTEEWAYNNPHFVERSSQMGPLSPTGPTPPPASAAYLAVAAARGAPSGSSAAAAKGPEASAQVLGPVEEGDATQEFSAPDAAPGSTVITAVAAGAFSAAGSNASTAADVEEGIEPRGQPQLRTSGRVYDSGPASAGGSFYLSCAGSRASLADMAPDSADADSNSSDGGKSMYGTPSAAFAASVITPFTVAPAGAANVSNTTFNASSNTESSAAAAATVAAAGGGGGGSRGGTTRFSGPSPSRLARVTSATGETTMPAPSLPPGTAARTASATSATVGMALHTSGGPVIGPNRCVSGIPRPQSGLPPRPTSTPTAAPAAAVATDTSATSNGGVTRRASGGYSLSDASYMTGLGGGLASLVAGGDEAPFSMSLRERYGGSSRGTSGGGSSSSAGGGGGSIGPVAAASRDSSGRSGGGLEDSIRPGGGGVGADRGRRKGSGSSGESAPMAVKGNSGGGAASRAGKGSGGSGLSTTGPRGWRR